MEFEQLNTIPWRNCKRRIYKELIYLIIIYRIYVNVIVITMTMQESSFFYITTFIIPNCTRNKKLGNRELFI